MQIATLDALRQLYAHPTERVLRKQIGSLDIHCRNFIGLSPFVVLSTCDAAYAPDASPRGEASGAYAASQVDSTTKGDRPMKFRQWMSSEPICFLSTRSVGWA